MSDEQYDYSFKIVVIGDSSVGKTNLLGSFIHGKFNPSSKSTIGLDIRIKHRVIKDKKVRLQMFDTAGQERYKSITNVYYRGAFGALVVYDITKYDSFENVDRWLRELRKNEGSPGSIVMLIGNKCDLESDRAVQQEEAMDYAKTNGLIFMETSALDNTNVELAFDKLTDNIYDRVSNQALTAGDKQAITHGETVSLNQSSESSPKGAANCAC